ncbi:hypothetical protein CYMTET_12162 [Cymbomonas tetramitiformis]|uniref:Uncharacterized protein n=1 Tax=Cymbomonas tetramitiformis TaxID=36881 RepID=A0AAE0GKX8_9CHLO|nr:hypothetical protein CYMTET_12162 [Cymbomonas tetramitiformis]
MADCRTAATVPALFVCLSMCLIGATTGAALCCGIATPSVVSAPDFWQTDTVAYDTVDFVIDNNFNMDSGVLDSDYFVISNLDFDIENNNNFNFCELCIVGHFQSG